MKYQAPLQEMRFVLFDVLQAQKMYSEIDNGAEATREVIDAVLDEAAKFCEQVLLPTNRIGDEEGCTYDKITQSVKTPSTYKAAYERFVDGGWPGLCAGTAYGGQGMPESLGVVVKEMIESCNIAWGTYPLLSQGFTDAVTHHGNDWQRNTFLPQIAAGKWTGTMCLTEPHCGSDLGLLKTKAEPQADGLYKLFGTKIFITAGEHDMSDNIVHLVLARLPDAPAGTKGISLFIVPKFNVNADGSLGTRNSVFCGSVEHKMGIKGSATCVMNFDGAAGYLVGEANRGLNAMFTMMNTARLGVGIQGLGLIEASYQNATAYALDRLQMRSLSGAKNPEKPADPLIVHPDIRRMLLTGRAIAQAGRALCFYCGLLVDRVVHHADAAERKRSDELLSFLIPICKALMTELAIECTSNGIQVLGGHGYIREWGLEQLLRDARITTIYEGTTQIQALDLLGRKIMQLQGVGLTHFLAQVTTFASAHTSHPQVGGYAKIILEHASAWQALTVELGQRAAKNPEEIGAAAVDYLMYSGYITLAYFMAMQAEVACRPDVNVDATFRDNKLATTAFYFAKILPRTLTHAATIRAGAAPLFGLAADSF
jgi:alkylation response protein AidB-like acyl-CoA dehydrogenase